MFERDSWGSDGAWMDDALGSYNSNCKSYYILRFGKVAMGVTTKNLEFGTGFYVVGF